MKPNIIVFMTDQQNAKTIDPNHQAITPNLTKFLKRSTRFTNAYCPAPHCCPSRASFFSGMYPSQHGVWNNVEVDNSLSRGLYDGITLFPEQLSKAGYSTAFSGKWHVSAYESPSDRGFDNVVSRVVSNFGFVANDNTPKSNEWENTYSTPENIDFEGDKKEFGRIIRPGYTSYYQFGVDENPYNDTTTVEKACEVLNNNDKSKPLFMYVGTTGPHDPYCPPQNFLDMYNIDDIQLPANFNDDMVDKPALYRRTKQQFNLTEQEHKESIRRYLAFISYEDYLFGRLIDTIEANNMTDNTIVIYLTDHGDYMGAHGLWAKGLPCFSEAYNICAAIGGPGIKQGVTSDKFISLADFAPTILELAGVENNVKHLGRSLVDILHARPTPDWRDAMYTQTNGNEIYGIQRAVFTHEWKYVHNSFDYDELYDLKNDPGELVNLINEDQYKPILKQLCKKMWQFAKQTKDTYSCPYIMVGLAPYGPGILFE